MVENIASAAIDELVAEYRQLVRAGRKAKRAPLRPGPSLTQELHKIGIARKEFDDLAPPTV